MIIHERLIEYYIQRLKSNDYFSFPGFSDSEWFCMLGERIGDKSGFGQTHTAEMGRQLLETLKIKDKNHFLPAVPKLIKNIIGEERLDGFLKNNDIQTEFYERDMVTDDLARDAGLYPLIKQLQSMPVYLIGHKELRRINFLNYKAFFAVSSPDFSTHQDAVDLVTEELLSFGRSGVYLFSCGIADAVIIGRLHDKIPNSFLIDCGSIWDAFVGIGGQRQWRVDLYADPQKLEAWKQKNLYGE